MHKMSGTEGQSRTDTGHSHRFLSLSPCVPIGSSSTAFFNDSCLQRTNAFILAQGHIGPFVYVSVHKTEVITCPIL